MGLTLRTRLRVLLFAMCQSRAGQRPTFTPPTSDEAIERRRRPDYPGCKRPDGNSDGLRHD